MIGFISGEVVAHESPHVVVNVGGVGYKVLVSNNVLSKINLGSNLKLFTHTHVREDAIQLYGFSDLLDLKLFEQLINVSGVGPKTAMSIFSIADRKRIIEAIITSDVSFFTAVPRLGRKNAQKIIIELRNKFGSVDELDLSEKDKKENNEIIAALQNFGFTKKEALDGIKAIDNKGETLEAKIKLVLKEMGK